MTSNTTDADNDDVELSTASTGNDEVIQDTGFVNQAKTVFGGALGVAKDIGGAAINKIHGGGKLVVDAVYVASVLKAVQNEVSNIAPHIRKATEHLQKGPKGSGYKAAAQELMDADSYLPSLYSKMEDVHKIRDTVSSVLSNVIDCTPDMITTIWNVVRTYGPLLKDAATVLEVAAEPVNDNYAKGEKLLKALNNMKMDLINGKNAINGENYSRASDNFAHAALIGDDIHQTAETVAKGMCSIANALESKKFYYTGEPITSNDSKTGVLGGGNLKTFSDKTKTILVDGLGELTSLVHDVAIIIKEAAPAIATVKPHSKKALTELQSMAESASIISEATKSAIGYKSTNELTYKFDSSACKEASTQLTVFANACKGANSSIEPVANVLADVVHKLNEADLRRFNNFFGKMNSNVKNSDVYNGVHEISRILRAALREGVAYSEDMPKVLPALLEIFCNASDPVTNAAIHIKALQESILQANSYLFAIVSEVPPYEANLVTRSVRTLTGSSSPFQNLPKLRDAVRKAEEESRSVNTYMRKIDSLIQKFDTDISILRPIGKTKVPVLQRFEWIRSLKLSDKSKTVADLFGKLADTSKYWSDTLMVVIPTWIQIRPEVVRLPEVSLNLIDSLTKAFELIKDDGPTLADRKLAEAEAQSAELLKLCDIIQQKAVITCRSVGLAVAERSIIQTYEILKVAGGIPRIARTAIAQLHSQEDNGTFAENSGVSFASEVALFITGPILLLGGSILATATIEIVAPHSNFYEGMVSDNGNPVLPVVPLRYPYALIFLMAGLLSGSLYALVRNYLTSSNRALKVPLVTSLSVGLLASLLGYFLGRYIESLSASTEQLSSSLIAVTGLIFTVMGIQRFLGKVVAIMEVAASIPGYSKQTAPLEGNGKLGVGKRERK